MFPLNSCIAKYYFYYAFFVDRIKELKKLNHSIVINFLELLDILIKSPSSPKVSNNRECPKNVLVAFSTTI